MGRVIVLGSLMTDLVARAPRFPFPGESLIGEEFAMFIGGKGFNQAVTAARLGAQTSLIGNVGQDAFGDAFFPALAAEGVDCTYVSRDTTTGTGVGCVTVATEIGQNAIVALPRANLTLSAETVRRAMEALLSSGQAAAMTPPGVFLTQCETSIETIATALLQAHKAGFVTILNAAPIPQETLPAELFRLVDILVVNEIEASFLAGLTVDTAMTAKTAAERLLERGPQHVIITLGALGATWCTHGENGAPPFHRWQRAFNVQQVDPTGAGDAFCGALAARLSMDAPLEEALRWANAAGAITVTRKGALPSLPTRAEVEALL
ncbi:ribokinase [Thermogemmatispora onikobensis]|uniref:ribokinase n=1 Tax=Thermogemmatispora onikobensis TaxID=732234 RepID=UPI000853089C|nr:ribokinase [Thermogemmatispora onikobensis]